MSSETSTNATVKQSLGDNYIYISHLDEGYKYWRLPFWPDVITDTMQSTFQQSTALGRSAPVFTFSNAGPRSVQISIKLHRDMMDDVNIGFSSEKLKTGEDYVDNLVRALQAIAVPKYNLSNKAVEPPLVALRIGKEIFIRGVVTSGIGLTYERPILANDRYAQVSLSMTISEVDPYDATTVFKNGGFRGLTNTMDKEAYDAIGAGRMYGD